MRSKTFKAGVILVVLSLSGILFTLYPAIREEIKYLLTNPDEDVIIYTKSDPVILDAPVIVPVDENFSIVIPKIGANSKVIQDVDPTNSKEYQQKLSLGVAHAKGTPVPGQPGNTFLFAHSTDNILNANRYNAVFYLLNKMEEGDKFYLIYNKEKYEYTVKLAGIVDADSVSYLQGTPNRKTATLMTCWPAGTTLKRFVVVGELVEE